MEQYFENQKIYTTEEMLQHKTNEDVFFLLGRLEVEGMDFYQGTLVSPHNENVITIRNPLGLQGLMVKIKDSNELGWRKVNFNEENKKEIYDLCLDIEIKDRQEMIIEKTSLDGKLHGLSDIEKMDGGYFLLAEGEDPALIGQMFSRKKIHNTRMESAKWYVLNDYNQEQRERITSEYRSAFGLERIPNEKLNLDTLQCGTCNQQFEINRVTMKYDREKEQMQPGCPCGNKNPKEMSFVRHYGDY